LRGIENTVKQVKPARRAMVAIFLIDGAEPRRDVDFQQSVALRTTARSDRIEHFAL